MSNKLIVEIMTKNLKKLDDLEKQLGRVKGSTLNLGSAAKLAAGAFAALGAGKAIKSFVNVGRSVENLETRFKFLFGSATEGAAAFQTLTEFASTVPFSLEQIAAASGNLAVVSEDATQLGDNLKLAGNIAAVTGLDFQTAGEQLQRALSGGIGAADLLREKGVTALLGFKQGTKVTVEETAAALEKVFGPGGRFGNAAESLAQTFDGVVSMLGDKLFNFQRIVGEQFVDKLTEEFGQLDKVLKDNQETIEIYARALGITLSNAVTLASNTMKFLKQNSDAVILTAQILIGLKLAAMFYRTATAIRATAVAMGILNTTMLKNPFLKIAIGLGSLAAGFFAAKKGADALTESIDNVVDQAKAQQLKDAIGSIEDAMIVEDPKVKENKRIAAQESAVKALLEKEKSFLDSMRILGEDALERNLRQEREKIEKLQHIRSVDVENYQQYTDLINKVEEEAAKERQKIYEAEQKKKDDLRRKNIEMFKQGKYKEADIEGITAEEKKEIAISTAKSTLDILASQNKKFFELQKAVKIAEAIQNTYLGATKAFAQGGILGFVTGALVIAAGMAQVAAIRGQQYPGRKFGGQAMAGGSYIVGENGPEIFSPSTTGSIANNTASFGESTDGVNINFNITTNDARGFDELLTQRQDLIITLVNRGLTERGKQRLV